MAYTMTNDPESLQQRIDALEQQVATLQQGHRAQTIRRRSEGEFLGLPIWEIAMGPDPEQGEAHGHARAIIAIGDIATGWLAIGGIARGIIALGGVAVGGVALGGATFGLLGAFGGLAVGTLALGGLAIGGVAMGGTAIGYVAVGAAAIGYYMLKDYTQARKHAHIAKGLGFDVQKDLLDTLEVCL